MKYKQIQKDIQLLKKEANKCFVDFCAAILKPMCVKI